METIRYGIVGGGFYAKFQLRALEQVRGIEVAGLVSRRPPEALSQFVQAKRLGEGRIFPSVREMAHHVDVVAIYAPNFARVPIVEEIGKALDEGAKLRAVICDKPLARNLREARQMIERLRPFGVPLIYFENQLHMKAVQQARAQLEPVVKTMGPLTLVRASEEHAGPHSAWFWDPVQQGGGVMTDMGCHSVAVAWYLLTPPGKPLGFLRPIAVQADLSLLKWGRPQYREALRQRFGVDYSKTPADDFATGLITFLNPETNCISKAQFTVSWMYDKQGLRVMIDGIGPGYAFEFNTLRSPLEVFVGDVAAAAVADAEAALEKQQATRGLVTVQPNEPDLYGYVDENIDALESLLTGRPALMDWDFGREIVKLTMAAYLSAERRATVDLTDPQTLAYLEDYVPLIQQGRGREVLHIP
ncbi:MAG: Gfo/Idh/MocA family oxidoreductase [Thermogutta sp.]|nr:Gfo/Idh/MocA family oxidoreductase [Thermogutta sp.]HPU05489.1 Gfo/Idh/MocA family oxidoreductase [Thermogutta sp.]